MFLHLYNSLFHCHNEKTHKFMKAHIKKFNSLGRKKNYISDDLFDSRVFKNKSRILSDIFDTKKKRRNKSWLKADHPHVTDFSLTIQQKRNNFT